MDLKPPESLKWTGNVDENWRAFKQQFHLYVTAMGLETKPDTRKVALLLTVAGPQAIEVYNTFVFDAPEDNDKLDVVLGKFDAHCTPKKNETYERYMFRSRMQHQEPIESFVTALRLKAQSCNFGTLRDSMIRDQIVFGVEDKKLRERLLRETDLTLDTAIKICQASELSQKHMRTFSDVVPAAAARDGDAAAIGAVSYDRRRRTKTRHTQQTEGAPFSCKRCGTQHKPRQCPAFGKICSSCHGKNHFAKQCFSEKKGGGKKGKPVNVVDNTDPSDTFFVGLVDCEKEPQRVNHVNKEDKWITPLLINGSIVTMRLDTGAKANLISISDIREMKTKPKILKKISELKDYNGQHIECLGTCKLNVTVKGKVYNLLFSVVNQRCKSLLVDKACEELELVKRVYCVNTDIAPAVDCMDSIVQHFTDVFKGFGTLPFTYKIQLKEGAQPVVHAPRRVPAPLRDALKKELERMTNLGVIRKVEEPTDWVNSMVVTKKKSGELRTCMDPKDLNENIKREHYQIPTREEIISEMAGASYFTKLDASQGFWQYQVLYL